MLENKCEKCQSSPALIIGATLILCTIIASAVIAATIYKVKDSSNTISVTGSTERTIKSDTAKWSSFITRTVSPDSLSSGSTQIKNDLQAVKDLFKAFKIDESEMTVNPVTISSSCDNQNNYSYDKFGNQICGAGKISGYTIQQSIIVESKDVDKITDLAQKAPDALIAKGLIFSSQSLEYYYTKLSDLRLEMLGEATANAQQRAEKIAQSTGASLGKIRDASQGVFQITPENSAEISDYGAFDTTAVTKKITAVVKSSFSLK